MPENSEILSILQVARTGYLPLSFSQQRLWLLDQLEAGSAAHNIHRVLRLSGRLNVEALQKALDAILARHQTLRTVFVSVEGRAVQVIKEACSVGLPLVDLASWAEEAREAEAGRRASEEVQRPFDLSKDLKIRGLLIRLREEDHVLVIVAHPIAADGWSMGVLYRELSVLYEALGKGDSSPLPPLAVQYADYAVWQRGWLRGEVLDSQLGYWKQQLAGVPQVLELPTDRRRPAVQTFRGGKRSLTLSRELSEGLKRLSRQQEVTLFMTLLAAFQVLLYRYTGQEDVVVGSPIANRNRAEIEGLIGFFANTLVLRTDLSGAPSFQELLGRVRRMCLEAYAHQDLPFEKLVEQLRPERDLSRNPLFQVMFVLQNAPGRELELEGLEVSPLEVETGTAEFDLTLSLAEDEAGLEGWLEYNSDLYDGATIERMLGHYQVLLEGAVATPEARISRLPLLTAGEQRQLLEEWNDTAADYPKDKCLHEWFEAQVERTPEAVAVVCEGQQLTYRELNARSNQLAHYLRKRGVGPEVLVGICVERSLEMVMAVLGILKAGGTYVPLEPSYPEERLAFILEDAQTPVLLTQQKLVKELPGLAPTAICLDTDWKQIASESTVNLKARVRPENLAYVIYTSGSTGKPKGVSISHHNVVRLFRATQSWFHFDNHDVWALFHSYAFDFSVWEIWGPLLSGGQLVVVPFWVARSPEAFCELLYKWRVTVLNQTPSAFCQLIESVKRSPGSLKPARLRTIILGGEALDFKCLEPWFEWHGSDSPQVVNMYGITETTVHATYRPVVRTDINMASGSYIGRPIPDLGLYILDPQLQPVPVGVAGEICIAGEGLGRGYLNRADFTAERFVPNPFNNPSGGRLYKSGDLGRYLPSGEIEYLGRSDHQVKIRGFRIEPGEIEAILEEHSTVWQSAVVVREDGPGEKCLVAYVVEKQGQAPTVDELRDYLKQKLPDYMVPSAFVVLDRLPMTPNGKLDQGALPAPGRGRSESKTPYLRPLTPVEQLMAGIWSDVLGVERVGVHDNFFELGGHSLLAMKLSSRLSAAIKRHISVRSLFLYPSIAALAGAVMSFPPFDGDSGLKNLHQKRAGPPDVPAEPPLLQPSSPHLKIERRSLLSLLGTGKIAPVDSAALAYFSDSILSGTDVTREEVIHDWYEGLPTLNAVMETSLGRIGIITVPCFRSELYQDMTGLLDRIVEALELARRIGARVVSMTGLIPSATEYGMAVAGTIAGRNDLPKITTGHATTAAAVVLAIQRILMESARDLGQERVGFLGLGSIGKTVLRLMLKALPHPAEITLCDLYSKVDLLDAIRTELAHQLDFKGAVRVLGATTGVPEGFYDSTLIVGATNVPEVLDLGLVREGTLLVDDSGPHCFKTEDAMRRFLDREDLLFTEGGTLQSPDPVTQLRYLPWQAEYKVGHFYRKLFSNFDPFRITGCVFSSLLSSRYDELEPTVGLAGEVEALLHYERLVTLGFRAAALHCEGLVLPQTQIRNFHRRFGGDILMQQSFDGKAGKSAVASEGRH